jgi:hypothetical protein
VAANDWLGLVEMCVVFLSNANTNDSAGRNINYWPFVENPEEVGLPPYPSGFQGPVPTRSSRAPRLEPVPDEDGRDTRIVYDVSHEEYGDEPRDFDDILRDPRHGDELMLHSERTYGEAAFAYDTDDDDWYDRDGYNRDGYDTDGYDQDGYDQWGYDRNGWDEDGYDRDGYDRDGYNRDGFNRDGWDSEGYNEDGYNRDGHDRDGYDRDGYDREGYDTEGYDEEGYSRVGLNRAGLTRDEEVGAWA